MTQRQAFDSQLQQAVQAHKQDRLQEATEQLQALLAQDEAHPEVNHRLGMIAMEQADWPLAEQRLRVCIEQSPDDLDARCNLAAVLMAQGHLQEAVNTYEQVLKRDDKHAVALEGIGKCLMAAGQATRALEFMQAALQQNQALPAAWLGVAEIFQAQGDFASAAHGFDQALALGQRQPELLLKAAEAHRRCGRFSKALALYPEVEPSSPLFPVVAAGRAFALHGSGQPEAALRDILTASERVTPTSAMRMAEAEIRATLGERDAVVHLCRQVLLEQPANGEAWRLLCSVDPDLISDVDMSAMEKAFDQGSDLDKVAIRFGMAGVYRKRGELQREVESLHEGNALRARSAPFDIAEWREHNSDFRNAVKRLLDEGATPLAGASQDDLPIFIAAMPRSGTTLLEQMLGSHSMVEAFGESSLVLQFEQMMRQRGVHSRKAFLESFAATDLEEYGALLRGWLQEQGPGPHRFTEKSMMVAPALGLLALAHSNACFIDIERDPMDVCWGCYSQLFGAGQHFSYSFEGCADFYVAHREQMAAWRELFPERIITLRYEDLVTHPREELQRLLEFCGLPWEDAVLEFADNGRAVVTASRSQVRKGLNTEGLGRSRAYGELLRPLRDALERRGVEVGD